MRTRRTITGPIIHRAGTAGTVRDHADRQSSPPGAAHGGFWRLDVGRADPLTPVSHSPHSLEGSGAGDAGQPRRAVWRWRLAALLLAGLALRLVCLPLA